MEGMKVWKLLWYCLYMCDKLKNQQQLGEEMGRIIHSLNEEKAISFLSSFCKTMVREWGGLDKWRLDKFYHLSHSLLKEAFLFLQARNWSPDLLSKFLDCLTRDKEDGPLHPQFDKCLTLKLDISQNYFPLLLQVSSLSLPSTLSYSTLHLLLQPFFTLLSKERLENVKERMCEHLFEPLFALVDSKPESDAFPPKGVEIDLNKLVQTFAEMAISAQTRESNRKLIYQLRDKFNHLLEEKTGKKTDFSVFLLHDTPHVEINERKRKVEKRGTKELREKLNKRKK